MTNQETNRSENIKNWLEQHKDIREGVSQEAASLLFEMGQAQIPHDKPSWDDTFLQIAYDISKRSPDAQTQVGAVVVNKDKHILGTGYNGWMPGIDDALMPNTRPLKHFFVIHSEVNALLNCEHRPVGATLYCTHKPCLSCFFACVAAGIAHLVYVNSGTTTNTDGKDKEWEVALFLARKKIKVRGVDFNGK